MREKELGYVFINATDSMWSMIFNVNADIRRVVRLNIQTVRASHQKHRYAIGVM